MRTLQVASGDFFSTYGGGQVYVKSLVDEMIRRGDDVAVLSFVAVSAKGQGGIAEYRDYKGATLVEIGGMTGKDALADIIRKISPDVIHTHSRKDEMCCLGKELNIPVVVTAHHGGILCPAGTLMNERDEICGCEVSHKNCLKCCLAGVRSGRFWYPFMKSLPMRAYNRLGSFLRGKPFVPFVTPIGQAAYHISSKRSEWQIIAELSTRMIAPSEAIAQAMVRNGIDSSKVTIIPHGIPLPDLEAQSTRAVESGVVKLFYVGRISRIKGLHILLEAFASYDSSELELHIVGGAGNKAEQMYMSMLQHQYRSDSRVVWHGKVEPGEVFKMIEGYDIMVHPAIFLEVFGLNISEALAMGKPVLATQCGGAEMQIVDGENGWLVEPNSVEALFLGIERAAKEYSAMSNVDSGVTSIADHCEVLNKLYSKI